MKDLKIDNSQTKVCNNCGGLIIGDIGYNQFKEIITILKCSKCGKPYN